MPTQSLTRAITQSLTRKPTDPGLGGGGALPVPAGFGDVPFGANFYRAGGSYSTDFVAQPHLTEGGSGVTTYYVDVATGNDSNPGTSAQPWKTLNRAAIVDRATAPAMLVKVKGGLYGLQNGLQNAQIKCANICFVPWDAQPIIVSNECTISSWTLDSDNTYYASLVGQGLAENRATAWDGKTPDAFGDYAPLIPAASLAACKASAGTAYTDTAAKRIYVHCADNRAPDADIHVFDAWGVPGGYSDLAASPSAATFYMEGFTFLGGAQNFLLMNTQETNKFTAKFKDCTFKYSASERAIHTYGYIEVAYVDCLVTCGHFDGFSYFAYQPAWTAPAALEIRCEARMNGCIYHSSNINQGSTAHNSSKVVRLNGYYHHNQNDQVADVDGSKAWILGCRGENGLMSGYAAFRAGGTPTDTTKMWLDGCSSTGNTYGTVVNTGSTMDRIRWTGDAATSGGGTLTTDFVFKSPNAEFFAGRSGFAFDPFDYSTMFQDSAGSTPVSANSQTLGKLNDLSGNGNHRTQATSGNRPLTSADGYVFDGSDDGMVGSVSTASSGSWTYVVRVGVGADTSGVLGFGSNTGGAYLGVYQSGSGTSTVGGAVTLTSITVDGVTVSNTRAALQSALAGGPHTVVMKMSALSNAEWAGVFSVGNYPGLASGVTFGREVLIQRDLVSDLADVVAWVEA